METEPIGTIHIKRRTTRKQVRQQRFIKVSHHGGYRNRWRPLARYWWEQHVGQIPAGCQVFHRDGDSLNDAPENLILTREQRFAQLFAIRSDARDTQRRRQSQAVAKSNRLRAQINATQMRLKAWYAVLPTSRVIVWRPCKTAAQARKTPAQSLIEMCRQDQFTIKQRGGVLFELGHQVEAFQGSEILRLSKPDGRLEGFWRIVPDTRQRCAATNDVANSECKSNGARPELPILTDDHSETC
ncbi:MAG: hypothetical protein JWM11_6515 [Planctomycetaceae bacterium]|nr:hypothetical protein [Planctomycetaceae bacterium]